MKVLIRGAGVAGLTLAHALARRGLQVEVAETRADLAGGASWMAGGMLAPWCECESADEAVLALGRDAAAWWERALPGHVVRRGTLVVAPPRDRAELHRFAARTSGHQPLDGTAIAALEPDLAGRFREGLFFPGEAHLDPRRALRALHERLAAAGVRFHFGGEPALPVTADWQADCMGMAAGEPGLRGVRGEMLILRASDVTLSRPVRLIHPRFPVYVVPRADHHFMVGATMIESDAQGPMTARSAVELLNAAYALHPAFAEAEIVETGVGVRPAFADNLPRVRRQGRRLTINGFYRHGFLLAPAMAERAASLIAAGDGSEEGELAHAAHG